LLFFVSGGLRIDGHPIFVLKKVKEGEMSEECLGFSREESKIKR
jgi:hypothetical protein